MKEEIKPSIRNFRAKLSHRKRRLNFNYWRKCWNLEESIINRGGRATFDLGAWTGKGEASAIFAAFDRSILYQDRKARILQDFVATREVGESPFSAFLKARKREGEDLRCFAMRLENLIDRTGVDPDNKRTMLIET